jgi:hypothetical protein
MEQVDLYYNSRWNFMYEFDTEGTDKREVRG